MATIKQIKPKDPEKSCFKQHRNIPTENINEKNCMTETY
jgi:hypothetical protein